MKIKIDSTWYAIENAETGEEIWFKPANPYAFHAIMKATLTDSQQDLIVETDRTLTISKKKEKAMFEAIAEQKIIYKLP